ncbi:hypothetical protein [[Eubacterium] cellulosolvens]
MPAPQATVLANLVKSLILSEQHKVPVDYKGDDDFEYNKDFDEYKPKVANPANLLKAPGIDTITVDCTDDLSKQIEEFVDEMCKGICMSWGNWQKAAMFSTGIINAVTCQITPGSLTSPPLMGAAAIIANTNTAGKPANFALFVKAIATAIDTAWNAWQAGYMATIMFPPTFSAFPGPTHPPTPNIPIPLVAGSSAGDAMMKKTQLSGLMLANLSGVTPDKLTQILFDTFAEAFCTVFETWKASTMISGVMGTGPIPTFAPPFVPAGPVVAGSIIPKPGVLL